MSARAAFASISTRPFSKVHRSLSRLLFHLKLRLPRTSACNAKGKIVRTEPGEQEGKVAAAAVIEEYEFLPQS